MLVTLNKTLNTLFIRTHEEVREFNLKIKLEQDLLMALSQLPDITISELEDIDEHLLSNFNKYIYK